ncbi:hypothetical protein [Bacillus nitratireducens]|uniref:Helix-turn-helix domain of resolvase n=2 Tax=Bacillus nitratireducens TaxID=2026193 RepID=A0ABU6PIV1_9BACI|nr:hypothetical protein [Bacillus nitratireducens]MED0903039.1 hypothetical protein [Bacillus nitratireducens]MED4681219.1 hypothetical protein [Bacillus nitratireducens]
MMEMLASGKTKVEVCEMFDVARARATLYRYIKEHDSKQSTLNAEESKNE